MKTISKILLSFAFCVLSITYTQAREEDLTDPPGSELDCFEQCHSSTYFNCVLKYYKIDGTYLGERTCKFRFPYLS